MGWIDVLSKTYDNYIETTSLSGNDTPMLLPISHSTAKAQVTITVDNEGTFLRAETVGNEDETVIPVTEDSLSRSSGIAPHALCDKLPYIAGDLDCYTADEKPKREYFNEYIQQLKIWVNSEYTHKNIKAIYYYLVKETVIMDLVEIGIIELGEDGKMSKNKVKNRNQSELFVRFQVETPSSTPIEVWLDEELYDLYDNYYQSQKTAVDTCCVTGETTLVSKKFPQKIRSSNDKAKLISSNDSVGFTYRGRFTQPSDTFSIGYVTSQKAHNALRWLIQKQGYKTGSSTIISWTISGSKIPLPTDTTTMLMSLVTKNNQNPDSFTSEGYTETDYIENLDKAINIYRSNLNPSEKVVVMSLDTADSSEKGRLAITFYNELYGNDFLDCLEEWHKHCSWRHSYIKRDDKYCTCICAPTPLEIALTAYGSELSYPLKADEKTIKQCINRILSCIVSGNSFPEDLVRAAVRNVGRPMNYSFHTWNRLLTNTCAMIRKKRYDKKEDLSISLDCENNERSYLFGRLLAVADIAEEKLCYEKGSITIAKRYWSMYINKPAKTWEIIIDDLNPHLETMYPDLKRWYEKLLRDIHSQFIKDDFSNIPLSELYLHGYYCQMAEIKKLNQKKEEES